MTNRPATWLACACLFLVVPAARAQEDLQPVPLDDGRQWLEAGALTQVTSPLLRAAVAAARNDATVEPLLRSVIREQPASNEAHQAYELLSRIYLRSGQYTRLTQNLDDWAAVFPKRPEVAEERADVETFRGLPDQANGPRTRFRLAHDKGDDFSLPVAINGEASRYLLDTGAWVSVMTEGEAARHGLAVVGATGRIGDASGAGLAARTTVVGDLAIGPMRFRDVSFFVVPSEEPGGILGMPILLALGRVQWSDDGAWEIGGSGRRRTSRGQNLVFFENKLLLATEVLGQRAFGTLDTGAVSTDLNGNFATQFAELVESTGTKRTVEITGLGGTTTFDAFELPQARFVIAGAEVALSPAQVTLQKLPGMGGECCIGNIGLDLLLATNSLTIDLQSMILSLGR